MASSRFAKICVIGAGTMGSGIAAQVANAGIDVLLLDVAGEDGARNAAADRALHRIAKSNPPLLMRPDNIERITAGNIEDDLERIAGCDWVVEAVVERLDVKRALYRDMVEHLKPDAIVSSNTSTIPIKLLMKAMPKALRQRFCITHFFNPVRYMRLLELVAGSDTDPDVIDAMADFCDRRLGKGVVRCADTPGFLGNRVGVFALQAAIHEATELGVKIEEADALFGRPMGIPKTGAFGLYDLIGLDLMADVVRSLRAILPAGDPFHEVGGENELINFLAAQGFTGNKGKGGFYRRQDGQRLALDLQAARWRPRMKATPELAAIGEAEGLGALAKGDDRLSRFCWRVLARVLTYAASLVPSVTDNPQDIDDAMKLGYNWVRGPFEMIDELGMRPFAARLKREGWPVPAYLEAGGAVYRVRGRKLTVRRGDGAYRAVDLPDGVVRFHMTRRTLKPVAGNDGASLFHLDGGVRLVEFHTKANALDAECMAMVRAAADDPGPGILIHNDAQHFSAGVNLERFLEFIEAKDWKGIDRFLADFQDAVLALATCKAPVVGAPSGLAIGGGYEVLAHCDKVVAHSNTVLGLVECAVGLVPGGGGVKETYRRWRARTGSWEEAAWKTFSHIGANRTGSSPDLAAELAYFAPDRDEQVMNRDRLVEAGLAALAQMGEGYRRPRRPKFKLAGGETFAAMVEHLERGEADGRLLPHDVTVGRALARIVTGGAGAKPTEAGEADLFAAEREAFVALARTAQTKERIEGLMKRGETVRN